MTFLAPWFLALGAALAAGIVGLHLLVTRQPPSAPLPTARFVPPASVEVVTLVKRPEDLWLLVLRVLLVLLLSAAFARPVWVPGHRPVAKVILADLGRQSFNIGLVRDSARAIAQSGDVVIGFDSVAKRISSLDADWASYAGGDRDGNLSTALVSAIRAAANLRASADSIEIVLISSLESVEWNAATDSIRAIWPGRIRLIRLAARNDSAGAKAGVQVRGASVDALKVAVTAAGLAKGDSSIRIVRDLATADDSLWSAAGGTLIRWYAKGASPGWKSRSATDTSGAVLAGDAVVVFPFVRRWQLDPSNAQPRVVARWIDGSPAAIEKRIGKGCIRDVSIPVPERGDLVLRSDFHRLLSRLVSSCDGPDGQATVDDESIERLAGSGALAASESLGPRPDTIPPIVPWLLGAALALAVLEPLLRRRLAAKAVA